MLIAEVANGARTTQRFGIAVPAVAKKEPAMWFNANRAYWVRFAGAKFSYHFHPGVDEAAAEGTAFLASEDGTVTLAGFHNGISGNVVRVEIRPGVSRYGGNHFRKVIVVPGQKVKKGQKLAEIGHSGVNTGNSTHRYVELYEKGIGWVCYNPDLFVPGGALQNDPRIQPIPTSVQLVTLRGAGCNIRLTPSLNGSGNIYATSREDGIYDRSGKRIHTNIGTGFRFVREYTNDDGEWYQVFGFNRTLYIHTSVAILH